MRATAKWAVERVLAKGGDDGDARALISRTDPLTRARARRALQNEIEAVLIATPDIETGRPLLEAVAERMGASASDARAPFWWPTLVTLVVVLGIGAAGFALYSSRAPAKAKASRFETLPEVADAYENGGRPRSLGAVGEELFGERFAEFVVAASRHVREQTSLTEIDLNKAERALIDPKYKAHVGDKVYAAVVGLAESARVTLEDGQSVWGDADELNAALAEAGLGYYVDDGTVDRENGTYAVFYTHVVERVQVYEVGGGATERVLWLRRLDRLNRRKVATGSTHENSKVALIRRDLVDEDVNRSLLPALEPESRFVLWPVQPSRPRPAEKDELEARAGAKIRADFVAAGVSPEDGARVAKLLAQRDDMMADLASRAREGGYNIGIPRGYLFDVTRYARLEPIVGKWVLEDIDKQNKLLADDDNRAVYARVRSAYVTSVELHELQHRLDYKREGVPPADLHKYLKRGQDGGEMSRFGRRLVTEYSAYLASIANSELPFATLIDLTEFAFDHELWNRTYADVAVAVVESLCRVAGIEHGELIVYRSVDRAALARVMLELFTLSRDELRADAKAAWESGFGTALVKPTLRKRAAAR